MAMGCFLTQNLRRCSLFAVLSGPCCGLLLLSACGGGSGVDSLQSVSSGVNGAAQKGPFLDQVPVYLYQLDADGKRTGKNVTVVTDMQGRFKSLVPWSGPTEAEATGHFYDELNAVNSTTARRVAAIFLAGDETTNLNLFTTLVRARAHSLIDTGETTADAIDQATGELQALFQLQLTAVRRAGQLDLSDGATAAAPDNANLLLFSAAVLSAGISETGLAGIAADFSDDGLLNGAALGDWLRIRIMATTFSLDNVALNVQNLGWVADAPDFVDLNNIYPVWVDSTGDTDMDGLSDRDEVLLTFTDPVNTDSDQDGLTDGSEVNTHATNPLSADTDNDQMADAWEIGNGLDPLLDDAGTDSDADGLVNLVEFQNRTNPQLGDSDGDGYSDSQELAAGGDPLDNSSLPLAFVSAPPLSVLATQNYSYLPGVTWPATPLTLTVQPAGMTINGGGQIDWTPLLAEAGSYAVTVSASAQGFTATQSFTLTVDPFNTGDINQDGFVDARDYLLAQRIALGLMSPSVTEFNRADVRLDGVITAADAVLIERLALGL